MVRVRLVEDPRYVSWLVSLKQSLLLQPFQVGTKGGASATINIILDAGGWGSTRSLSSPADEQTYFERFRTFRFVILHGNRQKHGTRTRNNNNDNNIPAFTSVIV